MSLLVSDRAFVDIIIEIETAYDLWISSLRLRPRYTMPRIHRSTDTSVWALAIFVLLLAMSVHFLMEDPNPSSPHENNSRTLWT